MLSQCSAVAVLLPGGLVSFKAAINHWVRSSVRRSIIDPEVTVTMCRTVIQPVMVCEFYQVSSIVVRAHRMGNVSLSKTTVAATLF